MTTIKKYFKGHKHIRVYSFLTYQVNGRLYIIGVNRYGVYLTDVLWGKKIEVLQGHEHLNYLTEIEFKALLFKASEAIGCPGSKEEKREISILWHKMSEQETVGKFASMVLK